LFFPTFFFQKFLKLDYNRIYQYDDIEFIHFSIQMPRRRLGLQKFFLTHSSFHSFIYPYYFSSYTTLFYLSPTQFFPYILRPFPFYFYFLVIYFTSQIYHPTFFPLPLYNLHFFFTAILILSFLLFLLIFERFFLLSFFMTMDTVNCKEKNTSNWIQDVS